MSIAQALLAEFEQEAPTTRRFLERLPAERLDWRPHPKSMSGGQLALHIASVPGGVLLTALPDAFEAPDFSQGQPRPASVDEVLAKHDWSVATVRETLPTIDDARMRQPLAILAGGRKLMELPRLAMLRSIMFNHVYHHRGQFGVYLRLMGAGVPAAYGPSGDEMPPGFDAPAA